jgi:hypothetical protein
MNNQYHKHAYLIIAHGDFHVLDFLITALDDVRNDIYLHVDKKVNHFPKFVTKYSRLIVLENRVDVRWGSFSQIEAELNLFDTAFKSNYKYDYYHLISGTHMPLKSQDELHQYYAKNSGKELIRVMYTNNYEVNFKLGRYHFFLNNYRYGSTIKRKLSQLCWRVVIKLQYWLKINRREPNVTIKANNWVSITHEATRILISSRDQIEKLFKKSFCGDEYLIPFIIENNTSILTLNNDPNILFNEFIESNPRELTIKDYQFLIESKYLFARKFSDNGIEVVEKIFNKIKSY